MIGGPTSAPPAQNYYMNYTEREWEHLVPRPEPRSYSQQIMRGGRGNDWAIVAGRGGGEEVELLNNIR